MYNTTAMQFQEITMKSEIRQNNEVNFILSQLQVSVNIEKSRLTQRNYAKTDTSKMRTIAMHLKFNRVVKSDKLKSRFVKMSEINETD